MTSPEYQTEERPGAGASGLAAGLAAARSGSVIAPLSHLGVVEFSGADAEGFLHGQLSCDVKGTAPDSSTYGGYCSPKGRVLANFLLWRGESGLLMALPRDLLAAFRKRISRFVLRSKVAIADASSSLTLIGCAGPQAGNALGKVYARLPEQPRRVARDAGGSTVIRLDEDRFIIAAPPEAAGKIRQRLSESLRPVAQEVWQWLDVRGGIPWITAPTQEEFVPQMANLDLIGGVSFDKGCYPGQEIVARTRYLGKLKRRMFLANVAAAAAPGDRLYSEDLGDQAGGTVVNATASPDGGSDVLAVVQTASRDSSTVHLKSMDGPVLRFLPLPYAVE